MYFRPQIIAALFLANTMAVTSQQADSDPIAACSSIPFTLIGGTYAYQLPFIEDCLASVPVDKENMIQHVSALNEVYAQTYAFYNVAKDPAASDPLNYQAELGYSLFDSPEEGVVDIDGELTRIIQSVEEEGATWATFWAVQSVANRLRDAHISMPGTFGSISFLAFLPDRMADKTMAAAPSFWNDPETKELKLKIRWLDLENEETSESVVETINGVSPYDFFLKVSNSPSIANLAYQSKGARFNALLTELDQTASASQGFYSYSILKVILTGRPSDAYPSEVKVKYEDGEEETYRPFLSFDSDLPVVQDMEENGQSVSVDATALQESINKQGSVSLEVEQAAQTIESSFVSRGRSLDVEGGDVMQFWDYQYPEDVPKLSLKYMVDYAILKVESFNELPGDEVRQAWSKLAAGAKEKGIKKLIVDISNNGGGDIPTGKSLSQLMYPSLEKEVFFNDYTAVVNEPMQIFRDELAPLYDILREVFTNETLEEDTMAVFQNVTDSFTDDRVYEVNTTIGTLRTFCEGDETDCVGMIGQLESIWASFVSDRNVDQIMKVMDTMMATMKFTDRFYTVARRAASTDCLGQSDPETCFASKTTAFVKGVQPQPVNLGGVPTNLTNRFSFYTSADYDATVETATQADADFDEYILLSNGLAGSTSSTFASKVEQIWKNKDKSSVDTKLTTVSYGGLTENNGDVTLTGFAGGRVGAINTEAQYIQFLIATILDTYFLEWLKEDPETFAEFDSALDKFIDSVADTPYFSNTKPRFPVATYYDTYMGPDALPLQYIKMPADEHIPFHYLQTKIQNYGDLEVLYEQTAEFFSNASVSASESSSAESVDPSSTASNDPPSTPSVDSPSTTSNDPSSAAGVFTGTGILGAVIAAVSAAMFL